MLGAVISDLEGRKAEEESAAKSRFMAVMSHELRTPMNAVLGFAQLLEMSASETLSDKQLRHLRNISESGRHLMRLIEDLLALSLLDSGGFALASERLALDEVAVEGADRVREVCREKGLELNLEIVPTEVLGDRRRLLEIVEILFSNAVKFTERGGHIRVAVGMREDRPASAFATMESGSRPRTRSESSSASSSWMAGAHARESERA